MTKAAIVKDAITYIKQLEKEVTLLRDEHLELETNEDTQLPKEEIKPIINQIDSTQQMANWGIQVYHLMRFTKNLLIISVKSL